MVKVLKRRCRKLISMKSYYQLQVDIPAHNFPYSSRNLIELRMQCAEPVDLSKICPFSAHLLHKLITRQRIETQFRMNGVFGLSRF